jgi:transposase
MSATVTPRRKAATLIRPRSAGVTSIVRRATPLERPRWEYLTELQTKELIGWTAAAPLESPRWRTNRVVNEAARRFGIEITVHVADRLLRRYGPWPRRRPKPKRRLTIAPVYD